MDLRLYYHNLRKAEEELTDEFIVLMSQQTPDGGKSGRMTEVDRRNAAQAIVDGRARVATGEEAASFYKAGASARRGAEQAALATKLQVNIITDSDLQSLRSARSDKK
jgi:hypothetical protein